MCDTRGAPKFVLSIFIPSTCLQRQQHPNRCIYLYQRDGFSPCSHLTVISMASTGRLKNHRLQRLNALAWALHSLRTSKQRQDNSGHAQSSWQCSHLHTIKWSLFSICCVPLPLSQSPGVTFAKNLWVRYSLTSYNLSVTRWRYSIEENTMEYFLQRPCMQGTHVMVSCSSLRGRSGGGCSCTSQGRCRSRFSLTARSASLCRFYSKIISDSPNTISNQHLQVSPPQNTSPAVLCRISPGTAQHSQWNLWEALSWKGLMEISTSAGKRGPLFLCSPASYFSCSALVNFVHYL